MSINRRSLLGAGICLGATLGLDTPALARRKHVNRFPHGFKWGAATSAFQIEGSVAADGRGPCIWDVFARIPGKVMNGDTGDIACDSYVRWAEDIALLASLGLTSYRFSIAWPRIQPDGRGQPVQRAIDHYSRIVDALLKHGIRPMPTLYHWDLPQKLEDEGGWPSRETGQRFVDYATIMGKALSDRVRHWTVFNEPKTFVQVGYWEGYHAPGRKEPKAALRASHVVNLAYGDSWRALKAIDSALQIGNALDVAPIYPLSDSAADVAAAKRWDTLVNQWYLVPPLTGAYPDGALPADEMATLLDLGPGDEARLKAGYDFIGVNHYTPITVSAVPHDPAVFNLDCKVDWGRAPGAGPHAKTAFGWDIYPPAFGAILRQVNRIAPGIPIEITENGATYDIGPDASGRTRDTARINYLHDYLAQVATVIGEGVPVRGYHAWSLLDNYEWASGYSQRFGLVHVDFDDPARRRRPKDSALWYARVAKANRL